MKQLQPAVNASGRHLQRLRHIYPGVSSLCLRNNRQQVENIHRVFPEMACLTLSYVPKLWPREQAHLGILSWFTALRRLHLLNVRYGYLSYVSELTVLSSLCVQEDHTQRYFIQCCQPIVDSVSALQGLRHMQWLGCPSIKGLQRLQCLVSLKVRGSVPAEAVKCLSRLTRLECNMVAVPFAFQLNQHQLSNTLCQIQSLKLIRRLCLKVKEVNGLQHFSALTKFDNTKAGCLYSELHGRYSRSQHVDSLEKPGHPISTSLQHQDTGHQMQRRLWVSDHKFPYQR